MELLAIKTLDQACRDARNLRPLYKNRLYQPGIETPPSVLREEAQKLLVWLESDNYLVFARLAGLDYEGAMYRKADLFWTIKAGQACFCSSQELPHEPIHQENYQPDHLFDAT